MNYEHMHKKTLENASESFKSLSPTKVGWRKGELALVMGHTRTGKSDYLQNMLRLLRGTIFATPGYGYMRMNGDTRPNGYKGYDPNSYWFDDMRAGRYVTKKPDWKCSAMERHIQKGDSQCKPNALIKALVNGLEPVSYGKPNPDRPISAKGVW
jgi:energy-coupling factor transporter ATP-binding protein EcfA2